MYLLESSRTFKLVCSVPNKKTYKTGSGMEFHSIGTATKIECLNALIVAMHLVQAV